jgi:hypothetical protein
VRMYRFFMVRVECVPSWQAEKIGRGFEWEKAWATMNIH